MEELLTRLEFKINDFQATHGPSHWIDAKSLKDMFMSIKNDISEGKPTPTVVKIESINQYNEMVSKQGFNRANLRMTYRGFNEFFSSAVGIPCLEELISHGNLIFINNG